MAGHAQASKRADRSGPNPHRSNRILSACSFPSSYLPDMFLPVPFPVRSAVETVKQQHDGLFCFASRLQAYPSKHRLSSSATTSAVGFISEAPHGATTPPFSRYCKWWWCLGAACMLRPSDQRRRSLVRRRSPALLPMSSIPCASSASHDSGGHWRPGLFFHGKGLGCMMRHATGQADGGQCLRYMAQWYMAPAGCAHTAAAAAACDHFSASLFLHLISVIAHQAQKASVCASPASSRL